ncbi:MAG: DUF1552 domain-containing protein, partial [Nannocystaceae bacterium]|nr:DUF1552 domain-containing protein [Nannocystaceae bacterium]
MMTHKNTRLAPLRRRAFLHGLAATTLALPFLESLQPRTARAAGRTPQRYVVIVGGTEQNQAVPSGTGPGYTMPAGLASLEAVREHITLISGVEVPTPTGPTAAVPPGGRGHTLHGDIMPPLLTGFRTPMYALYEHATSDQVVAPVLAGDTPFESLQFRAQPHNYKGSNGGVGGVASARVGGANMTPQTSPRLAWEQLVLGIAPDDPTAAAGQARRIARQKSVLDHVLAQASDVKARVSKADSMRMEAYFDDLRDLELRIDQLGGGASGGACVVLPDPGADPAQSNFPSEEQGGTTGYSGGDERSEVFIDLIHLAFACDLSRVATFQSTIEQCFMSLSPLWGVALEAHDITHVNFPDRAAVWASFISWQASFFARL